MSECPGCRTEVIIPTKTWSMVGKPNKRGERFKLTLGLFTCSRCNRRFRGVVRKERVTLKGISEEIKLIEKELGQSLNDLREKIEKLKCERTELLDEIEKLKRSGEKKANNLEDEVSSLREELEDLKEMLGDFE